MIGELLMMAFETAAGGGDVITLTDNSNTAFNFSATAIAFIWLNSDGTVDEQDNSSSKVQVNASTDWVIPNGSAPGSYRAKHSSMTGDTGNYVGSLSSVYSVLTSDKYYAVNATVAGTKSITFTAHIDDTSTEQDTATFTLTATREDF